MTHTPRPTYPIRTGESRPPETTHHIAADVVPTPWRALWAMMLGFFMIIVDSTIVAVANPTIMNALRVDYDKVIWVTSAYLLAYAVLLLLAARLGDRFGPRNVYLIGLAVFTIASLWCGRAESIGVLISGRVVQGVGAALITPQTLTIISRIFPAERRGAATSVWAATAGIATLVGPLAGGVLVDQLGWQWIFFLNLPFGLVGFVLAAWLVPTLPRHEHRFDLLGVALSAVSVFLIAFGLQEGQPQHWTWWIWGMLAAGLASGAGFLRWQAINQHEPLVPLAILRDRNFSLSTFGYAAVGFTITSAMLPVFFYAQLVCGLSPTRSALLTAPISITMALLVPIAGRICDRAHPRLVIGSGFVVLIIGLLWLSLAMTPTMAIWKIELPMVVTGVGFAFTWSPLAATATRNLPPRRAGAGSGVYNAMRQIGSVLGSAAMAAYLTSRVNANLPALASAAAANHTTTVQLPAPLHPAFATAMSQSMRLPVAITTLGLLAALALNNIRSHGEQPTT